MGIMSILMSPYYILNHFEVLSLIENVRSQPNSPSLSITNPALTPSLAHDLDSTVLTAGFMSGLRRCWDAMR